MVNKPRLPINGKIADNSARWPDLAMLASAAGCDCQMLALTIADGFTVTRATIAPLKPKA